MADNPKKNAEGYNDPTPYEAEKHIRAQIRGKQARLAGSYFEAMISGSCDYYLDRGLAKIEKTPEPMKPLGPKNYKGQFLACYKTVAFNWVKQNKTGAGLFWGLGNWTRSNSEICLLAVKGKPKRMSASVHSVILSPVQQHSRKPAETRDRIVELMGDLPRIELFAREAAPGWDAWGNEAPTPGARKEETNGQNDPGDPAPEL